MASLNRGWNTLIDSEEESSDDVIMSRAFAVQGELSPEAGPPTNGEDYLRQVRWEARRCPSIVIAKPPAASQPPLEHVAQQMAVYNPMCPPAPPGLAPSKEWEQQFLAKFSVLRRNIERACTSSSEASHASLELPSAKDEQQWRAFCLGTAAKPSKPGRMEATPPHPPTLAILRQLDAVSINRLLEYHIAWLASKEPATPEAVVEKGRVPWLYFLMARVDLPLNPDIAASLRVLIRYCCRARAVLVDPQDPRVPQLNILITLAAKFFGQQDPEMAL